MPTKIFQAAGWGKRSAEYSPHSPDENQLDFNW